jgi:hypothetical protein
VSTSFSIHLRTLAKHDKCGACVVVLIKIMCMFSVVMLVD